MTSPKEEEYITFIAKLLGDGISLEQVKDIIKADDEMMDDNPKDNDGLARKAFIELVTNVSYAYHDMTVAAKIGDPDLSRTTSTAHTLTWNSLLKFVGLDSLSLVDKQKVKDPYEG